MQIRLVPTFMTTLKNTFNVQNSLTTTHSHMIRHIASILATINLRININDCQPICRIGQFIDFYMTIVRR